ncbi:hypothetical protein D3C76_1660080 [compost metagenome]
MVEQGHDATQGRAQGDARRYTGELLYRCHQVFLVAPAQRQDQGMLFAVQAMEVMLGQAKMRAHALMQQQVRLQQRVQSHSRC